MIKLTEAALEHGTYRGSKGLWSVAISNIGTADASDYRGSICLNGNHVQFLNVKGATIQGVERQINEWIKTQCESYLSE